MSAFYLGGRSEFMTWGLHDLADKGWKTGLKTKGDNYTYVKQPELKAAEYLIFFFLFYPSLFIRC